MAKKEKKKSSKEIESIKKSDTFGHKTKADTGRDEENNPLKGEEKSTKDVFPQADLLGEVKKEQNDSAVSVPSINEAGEDKTSGKSEQKGIPQGNVFKKGVFSGALFLLVLFIGYKIFVLNLYNKDLAKRFSDASFEVSALKQDQEKILRKVGSLEGLIGKKLPNDKNKEVLTKLLEDIDHLRNQTVQQGESFKSISGQFSQLQAQLELLNKEKIGVDTSENIKVDDSTEELEEENATEEEEGLSPDGLEKKEEELESGGEDETESAKEDSEEVEEEADFFDSTQQASIPSQNQKEDSVEKKQVASNLSDNIVIDEKYKEGVDNFFNLVQYTCDKISEGVNFIIKWVKEDGIKKLKENSVKKLKELKLILQGKSEGSSQK